MLSCGSELRPGSVRFGPLTELRPGSVRFVLFLVSCKSELRLGSVRFGLRAELRPGSVRFALVLFLKTKSVGFTEDQFCLDLVARKWLSPKMAFRFKVLLERLDDGGGGVLRAVVDELVDIGETQVIDAACLDDENIVATFTSSQEIEAARRVVQLAGHYKDGWASWASRAFACPSSSSSSTPSVAALPPPTVQNGPKSSVRALQTAIPSR